MATTSYLYHALDLIHHLLLRSESREGAVYYHVIRKREKRFCAGCGAPGWEVVLAAAFTRVFRALPMDRRPQFVVLHGHEQRCRRCGSPRVSPSSSPRASADGRNLLTAS